jgi:hypothetical protein
MSNETTIANAAKSAADSFKRFVDLLERLEKLAIAKIAEAEARK